MTKWIWLFSVLIVNDAFGYNGDFASYDLDGALTVSEIVARNHQAKLANDDFAIPYPSEPIGETPLTAKFNLKLNSREEGIVNLKRPLTTGKIVSQGLRTEVNYDDRAIVLTASVINRNKQPNEILYGGNFSPTAAAHFKFFKNYRLKTFVQASCLDYYCQNLMLSFGVRTNLGNSYALNEPKIVVSRLSPPF